MSGKLVVLERTFHYIIYPFVLVHFVSFPLFFLTLIQGYVFNLILERREGESEKKNIMHSTGNLTGARTCNRGVCPKWESNLQPFGVRVTLRSPLSHLARVVSFF